MQSRRARLPDVDEPVAFDALMAQSSAPVAIADIGATDGPSLAVPFVLVGPEGGWSDAERAAAGRRVSLGPSVLRAETAAVAAGVLLAALRSSLVSEAWYPGSS
jgi:RsmE family RNA methyltransferase